MARTAANLILSVTKIMPICVYVNNICQLQLTELPQGVIAVLDAIYTTHVHTIIYINVGNFLDLLSLINCFVGFTAFVKISSKYRQTFLLLCARVCK